MRLLCRWRACLSDIESAGAVTVKMPPAITDGFFPGHLPGPCDDERKCNSSDSQNTGLSAHLKIRAVNFHITGHHPAVD